MTQEQKVRTRDEQVDALRKDMQPESGCYLAPSIAANHIAEAEARGAAEERGKGTESCRVFYVRSDTLQFSSFPFMDVVLWKTPVPDGGDFTALYTRPANVAALEARIAEMQGALTRIADSEPFCGSQTLRHTARAALKREGGV